MAQRRLYSACKSGDFKEIQQLHARGTVMDVTRPRDDGATPMLIACEFGHFPNHSSNSESVREEQPQDEEEDDDEEDETSSSLSLALAMTRQDEAATLGLSLLSIIPPDTLYLIMSFFDCVSLSRLISLSSSMHRDVNVFLERLSNQVSFTITANGQCLYNTMGLLRMLSKRGNGYDMDTTVSLVIPEGINLVIGTKEQEKGKEKEKVAIIGCLKVGSGGCLCLTDVTMKNPSGFGLAADGPGAKMVLESVTVVDCQSDGVHVTEGAKVVATDCQIFQNGRFGMAVWGNKTTARLTNCTIHHNKVDGLSAGFGAVVDLMGEGRTTPSFTPPKRCSICDMPKTSTHKLKNCKCKGAQYCNSTCQKSHWKSHKNEHRRLCKEMKLTSVHDNERYGLSASGRGSTINVHQPCILNSMSYGNKEQNIYRGYDNSGTIQQIMDQQKLYSACESGDLKEIQQLHARGADMDVTQPKNNGYTLSTPMYIACENGHFEIVQWLHAHGAAMDITRPKKDGSTPMQIVCKKGHLKIVQWLYTHGYPHGTAKDITRPGYQGKTSMDFACQEGHLNIVQHLIRHHKMPPETIEQWHPRLSSSNKMQLHQAAREKFFDCQSFLTLATIICYHHLLY